MPYKPSKTKLLDCRLIATIEEIQGNGDKMSGLVFEKEVL